MKGSLSSVAQIADRNSKFEFVCRTSMKWAQKYLADCYLGEYQAIFVIRVRRKFKKLAK